MVIISDIVSQSSVRLFFRRCVSVNHLLLCCSCVSHTNEKNVIAYYNPIKTVVGYMVKDTEPES